MKSPIKRDNKCVNLGGSKGGFNRQENHEGLLEELFHSICHFIVSAVGTGNNKKHKVELALDEEANYLTLL